MRSGKHRRGNGHCGAALVPDSQITLGEEQMTSGKPEWVLALTVPVRAQWAASSGEVGRCVEHLGRARGADTRSSCAAYGRAGEDCRAGKARPLGISVPQQNPNSKGLLVKLGLLGPEQTTQLALRMQQLRKLLVKLGRLGSPSMVSRQHPLSQCPLVKPGPRGPEQRAHPLPLMRQPRRLLMKLGLMELQSRVPRRNLNSWRVPVKLDLFGPELVARPIYPLLQQSHFLRMKLDLQGLPSTAPRQSQVSECPRSCARRRSRSSNISPQERDPERREGNRAELRERPWSHAGTSVRS